MNRRLNLTRITDPAEAGIKHYADSLSVVAWACGRGPPDIRRVLDVGTGGGFPAVPVAVARPDWHVTALDSRAKKVRFVADCAARIGLTNLRAEHGHTDHWRIDHSGFDLVTFRAVGKLAECITRSQPLLAPDGWLICYKSASIGLDEERAGLDAAQRTLLRHYQKWTYSLPINDQSLERMLITLRKSTPDSLE